MKSLLLILLYVCVVKTVAHTYVRKQPPIFKPLYWIASKVGLDSVRKCAFCAGFWVSMTLTVFNIFITPQFVFNPVELLGYNIVEWYDYILVIGLNGLFSAGINNTWDSVDELYEVQLYDTDH